MIFCYKMYFYNYLTEFNMHYEQQASSLLKQKQNKKNNIQKIVNNPCAYQQLINYNSKMMRQDLRQRQKQIRKLHESIEKYQQSPNTKKAVEQATLQLMNAIQYKYRKSQTNRYYVFPRSHDISDDQYDLQPQIVDLKSPSDFISHQLSIADEPQSNVVYISQKTVLNQQKYSPFSKVRQDCKSKLKIKVFKKKNFETCQTTSKLNRLKTEHIHANFSTISYKNQEQQNVYKNQSSTSKSRLAHPSSQANRIRKKLKIASRAQNQSGSSPSYVNLTMKTQYTHCIKRKQGKQNQRIGHTHQQDGEKYFASHNSTKKLQPNHSLHLYNKPYMNVKFTAKKNKQNEINQTVLLQNNKKNRTNYKSFQSLKSIRLGNNRSSQKIKVAKGLHA